LLEFRYISSLENPMQAFEVTGAIDPTGRLTLDQPLQVSHPGRIRLIVLLEEADNNHVNVPLAQASTISSTELATNQFSFDPDAQPIWELAAEISAQVPDEEWAKLPTDLAKNFDKYQRQRNDE
jgi:RecA-family ATPase